MLLPREHHMYSSQFRRACCPDVPQRTEYKPWVCTRVAIGGYIQTRPRCSQSSLSWHFPTFPLPIPLFSRHATFFRQPNFWGLSINPSFLYRQTS